MKPSDILNIEQTLGVKLPQSYGALMGGVDAPRLERAGVFGDVTLIIERTKEQRQGYGGAPKWPDHLVYIGDQEDACPYALDVRTGSILQTDHGDHTAKPLARYDNPQALAAWLLPSAEEEPNKPAWWTFWKK